MEDNKRQVIEDAKRTKTILVIRRVETLDPVEKGVEFNAGYEYDVDGPLPEIADGIAKMAKQLDGMKELGENAGAFFLELCRQFYEKA